MSDGVLDFGSLGEATVFLDYFKDLPDPRQAGKVIYPLNEVLLLSLLAVLAKAESFTDIARFGEKKLALLLEENAMLSTKVSRHEIENGQLRAQLQNSQPVAGGFRESMGVFWKRTATGFEPHPYCNECAHHPVMMPVPPSGVMRPMFWMCSSKHQAPYAIMPPST